MPKGKKSFGPKDPFAELPEEFKDAIDNCSREDIERRIAKVAMDDVELRKCKKDDQDLKEKQEAASFAAAVYRDGFKANKLRIEFMKRALDDKGGPTKSETALTSKDRELIERIKNPGGGTKVSVKGFGMKDYVQISGDTLEEGLGNLAKGVSKAIADDKAETYGNDPH